MKLIFDRFEALIWLHLLILLVVTKLTLLSISLLIASRVSRKFLEKKSIESSLTEKSILLISVLIYIFIFKKLYSPDIKTLRLVRVLDR